MVNLDTLKLKTNSGKNTKLPSYKLMKNILWLKFGKKPLLRFAKVYRAVKKEALGALS